jgi:hypothetical protein
VTFKTVRHVAAVAASMAVITCSSFQNATPPRADHLLKSEKMSASLAVAAAKANTRSVPRAPRGADRPAAPDGHAASNILETLSIGFEPNTGQADQTVDAVARAAGATVYLSRGNLVMRLQRRGEGARTIRIGFAGANTAPDVVWEDELPGVANYLLGADPAKWRIGVKRYARVRYRNVYPGIDVVFYGRHGEVEYDFEVSPGASPSPIRITFTGADDVKVEDAGDLVLRVADHEIRQRAPVIYQAVGADRRRVEGRYLLRNREAHVALAAYDRSAALVIDPTIVFSTYLGGSSTDQLSGLASDAAGAVYVLATTWSADFPTINALNPGRSSYYSSVLVKMNANGNALEYSTYLSGLGLALAVAPGGEPFVLGSAWTTDNPPAANGYRFGPTTSCGLFVLKLDASASKYVYEARICSDIEMQISPKIAVGPSGEAVVVGEVNGYFFGLPIVNAVQPIARSSVQAFAFKLTADGANLVYSTYLGGEASQHADAVAVGANGNAVLAGMTTSKSFPVVNPLQSVVPDFANVFVTELDSAGQIVFSTTIGGSEDEWANGVALDSSGFIYVTGVTTSPDFPTANAHMSAPPESIGTRPSNAFVVKLAPLGSGVVYSTFLGGRSYDTGEDIIADASGAAIVTGITYAAGFPLRFSSPGDAGDFGSVFLTRLSPSGDLLQSTYFADSYINTPYPKLAAGPARTIYLAGHTLADDFPTKRPLQAHLKGTALFPGPDLFIMRLEMRIATPDFDGDVSLDLVLQNQADGRLEAWAMNGLTRNSVLSLAPSQVADTGWKIIGTGDFDGDSYLDLVWQHDDGRIAVWFMNGTTQRSGTLIDPPLVDDLQWRIRAVADLNHDGRADLIWRHQGDGRIAVWFMDGNRMISGTLLTPGQVDDLGWDIVGAGDFNGDDEWDLVWQHADGRIAVWLMHGTELADGSLISPPQVSDTSWRIRGAGDINGDGHCDLIWQNEADGRVAAWLMHGLSLVDGTLLTPNHVSDLNWKIVGPR